MSQLSVDSITGRVAGTSPTFPNGFNVTGIVTATVVNQNITGATSFQGSTTFDNGFTVSGATGIITATGFSGPLTGAVSGNATGLSGSPDITVTNVSAQDVQVGGALTVTGNLTVNGTTTTIDTVVTAVDSLTVDGAISAADYQGNFILDTYLFS
tara:strand:+ start:25 stop:489 length:465 start_codon:yes stop_codon:yes gene_type:complete